MVRLESWYAGRRLIAYYGLKSGRYSALLKSLLNMMVNSRHSLHMIRDTDFGPFFVLHIFLSFAAKTCSPVLTSNGQRYIF